MKRRCRAFLLLVIVSLGIAGCADATEYTNQIQKYGSKLAQYQSEMKELLVEVPSYESTTELPPYDGNIFVVIDDNVPDFTEEEITDVA